MLMNMANSINQETEAEIVHVKVSNHVQHHKLHSTEGITVTSGYVTSFKALIFSRKRCSVNINI